MQRIRSCLNFAGIAPGVTPRQDRLSGVIICLGAAGQRLTGRCRDCEPARAVNSITATTAVHYNGGQNAVSSEAINASKSA